MDFTSGSLLCDAVFFFYKLAIRAVVYMVNIFPVFTPGVFFFFCLFDQSAYELKSKRIPVNLQRVLLCWMSPYPQVKTTPNIEY